MHFPLDRSDGRGLHGGSEQAAFDTLVGFAADERRCDALCRLTLLGTLPAVAAADLAAFGESVHEFNVRAGEMFAAAQGGIYASPEVAALVAWLRGQGVRGVGQSSWGPTVFAVVGDESEASPSVNA